METFEYLSNVIHITKHQADVLSKILGRKYNDSVINWNTIMAILEEIEHIAKAKYCRK